MTAPLAAITGGTGFVGRHIVRTLRDAGWRLRLLVRRDPDIDLGGEPVELVPGGLSDPAALDALVAGADAVIHIAGVIKAKDRAGFMTANADGTGAVVAAMQRSGSRARFVMMSSLAAREPALSHYAASKQAGETLALSSDLAAVILRPAAIYGPGDRETLSVFKAAGLPIQPILNGPAARICLVHVTDVARGVLCCLEGAPAAGIYEMSDQMRDGYSWIEIVSAACAAVGRTARPVTIPSPVVRAVGRIGDVCARLTGSAEMITSQKVREILHPDWGSKADAQLPPDLWQPLTDIHGGFGDTVTWYRAHRWLG